MDVEKEIASIKQRNAKVERDKRWETSWTRRILIAIMTYLIIVLYGYLIGGQNVWLTSLIPVLGFILSTVSLRLVRKIWEKHTK